MTVNKHDFMMTWVSLVHAGSYLPAELGRFLQDKVGISLAEQDLLKQLEIGGGEMMLVELSRRIYLSKAGISKMMNRLEASGFVKRVPSKTDGRVIMARITREGTRVLARSRELLVPWVAENLHQHLSDEQLLALKDALQALLQGHNRWQGQLTHLAGGAKK